MYSFNGGENVDHGRGAYSVQPMLRLGGLEGPSPGGRELTRMFAR